MKHSLCSLHTALFLALGGLPATFPDRACAETAGYYIGIDTQALVTSGTYKDLPNPNFNRLTFLLAATSAYVPGLEPAGTANFAQNHFRTISAYSYSGPSNTPAIQITGSNNRIPELVSGQHALTLGPASTGLFAGKLVTARSGEPYSDMRWWTTDDLNQPTRYGPGSPEWILFHSNADTRTNSLRGAVVHLELVSKTTGLHIGTKDALDVLTNPGDRYNMGSGESFRFAPVFWVDGASTPSSFSATFKLVDVNTGEGRTPIKESGLFTLNFRVPPEPQVAIAPAVHLNLPLATAGYILEAAPSLDGPWRSVSVPPGSQTGDRQTVTLPAIGNVRVFRFRKL